jgi:hypothetical protein
MAKDPYFQQLDSSHSVQRIKGLVNEVSKLQVNTIGWKHGKVYNKSWQKNIKFNRGGFSQKCKKVTTPVFVINVTHIICEQCFYTSLSVINVNNLNSALTLIQA